MDSDRNYKPLAEAPGAAPAAEVAPGTLIAVNFDSYNGAGMAAR